MIRSLARTAMAGTIAATCALAVTTHASPSHAKPGDPPQTVNGMSLNDYLGSEGYWTGLKSYVLKYERVLGPCPTPKFERRIKAVPARQAIAVPGAGVPPQWYEILEIKGCSSPFKRMVFTALVKGRVMHRAMLSGGSKTDPVLQWDVLKALVPHQRSSAEKAGCTPGSPVRLLGAKLVPGGNATRWSEIWGVADCTGIRELKLSFTTSAAGGTVWKLSAE
ncbi:MAG: hypothetical protein AAF441_17845 [Pseudomonadota bacterium]